MINKRCQRPTGQLLWAGGKHPFSERVPCSHGSWLLAQWLLAMGAASGWWGAAGAPLLLAWLWLCQVLLLVLLLLQVQALGAGSRASAGQAMRGFTAEPSGCRWWWGEQEAVGFAAAPTPLCRSRACSSTWAPGASGHPERGHPGVLLRSGAAAARLSLIHI